MIARRRVLAGEYDIAPFAGLGHEGFVILFRVGADLNPGERAGSLERSLHVEPQRISLARRDPPRAFFRAELLRHAGIEWRAVRIVRPRRTGMLRDVACDFGAALKAGIDQALRLKIPQRLL